MHYLAEHQTFDSTAELNTAVYEHIKRNTYELNDTDRLTLKTIARYAVKFAGAAHLKAETLADLIGKSVKTARRAVNKLASLAIIQKIATTRKINGGHGANIIVILPVGRRVEDTQLSEDDQSTMTTREDAETPTEPTDEASKITNEPSHSINLSKNHVIDTVPACGLKNALPSEIYSAMARYFEADEIYKYYGILLRAKASVDPTLILEEHPEPFVEAWHAAILKRKQQKIRRFDDYLYASFRQAAWTVKARENRVKNVGLLAEFETFLQAE